MRYAGKITNWKDDRGFGFILHSAPFFDKQTGSFKNIFLCLYSI